MRDTDRLSLARDYPYAIPTGSFLFARGQAFPYVDDARIDDPTGLLNDAVVDTPDGPRPAALLLKSLGAWPTVPMMRRHPVLAVGSNQSPVQLARKFGADPEATIVVRKGRLTGFDVVFAAQFTSYGAVPATLAVHAGGGADLAVTWLTDAQLERMHQTEGNYHFVRLPEAMVLDRAGGADHGPFAYVSHHGCLEVEGDLLPLAAVTATGRARDGLTTGDALALAHRLLDVRDALDSFIHRLIDEADYRHRCAARLRERHGRPFDAVTIEFLSS